MTDNAIQHPLLTALMGPPPREIEKAFVAGLVISTTETYDIGWETAIAVEGGDHWYPVERYENRSAAELGHTRWIERAPSLTEVTDLGLPGYIEPRIISLARQEK